MLQIQNKQLAIFKIDALKKFENEMVEHVKEFFPNHFIMMKEEATRETIKYAYERAKKYGFTTQRNVCLYLNNMLVLGSGFDNDPLFPWANEILNEKKISSPISRIDKLSDSMLEVFGRIRGPEYKYINAALLNFSKNSDRIFEEMLLGELETLHSFLKNLYPKKYEIAGESNVNQLIYLGKERAMKYGFSHNSNKIMFISFMFLFGSGFDNDPQFSWVQKILNDSSLSDQDQKAKAIFDLAIQNLNYFLNQYNIS